MTVTPHGGKYDVFWVTIPNGASVAPVANLDGFSLVGIEMPAAWTAASLTFQAAASSDANVQNMYDATGTEYTVTAAAARYIQLPPADFIGVQFLIVRSGTSGTPVAQGADRVIGLVCRPLQ